MSITSREIINRLKREGWEKVGQKGSHTHWKHADKPGKVTVPHPKKSLPPKTLISIYRMAGWGEP